MKDWRITNQHRYLDDAALVWDEYPKRGLSDHAHYEFCMLKFPDDTQAGYRTIDYRH